MHGKRCVLVFVLRRNYSFSLREKLDFGFYEQIYLKHTIFQTLLCSSIFGLASDWWLYVGDAIYQAIEPFSRFVLTTGLRELAMF